MEEIFKTLGILQEQIGLLLEENNMLKEQLKPKEVKVKEEPVKMTLTSVEKHEDNIQTPPKETKNNNLLF